MSTSKLANPLFGKAPVLEGLPEHPAVKAIAAWSSEALVDAKLDRGEVTLTVPAEEVLGAAGALKAAGYSFFEDMTAVDWYPSSPRFQLSYHLLSHGYKEYIRLRVMLEAESPSIETMTSLWPAANFYEREVFDLFGIRFEGHPNLRRILMPEEWEGHPLRKDYPVEGYR
jgi:NADH-quinone oxidoreductase subunit C